MYISILLKMVKKTFAKVDVKKDEFLRNSSFTSFLLLLLCNTNFPYAIQNFIDFIIAFSLTQIVFDGFYDTTVIDYH